MRVPYGLHVVVIGIHVEAEGDGGPDYGLTFASLARRTFHDHTPVFGASVKGMHCPLALSWSEVESDCWGWAMVFPRATPPLSRFMRGMEAQVR